MITQFFKWLFFATAVGIFVGLVSFMFLITLNKAIELRSSYFWLITLLPLAGYVVAKIYKKYAAELAEGNNLILDEIHNPTKTLPARTIPFIFASATLSHLFGASVGREGVAVQMGSAISDNISAFFKFLNEDRPIVLMIGMSAGFAAIFGTPLAGTIFGLEILSLWPQSARAILPCLIASYVGHFTATLLGATHVYYGSILLPELSFLSFIHVCLAAVCFGLAARFFNWIVHYLKDLFKEKFPDAVFHPVIGGSITVIIVGITGTDRYQGLGLDIMQLSFLQHVYPWDFVGKIGMTAISIGSGFRGGEVMSLFFIGVTLGNALSFIIPLSISLLAALGFISVFVGVANTPVAGLVLALSLFDLSIWPYAAPAVAISYLVSGHKSIYRTKRLHRLKKF